MNYTGEVKKPNEKTGTMYIVLYTSITSRLTKEQFQTKLTKEIALIIWPHIIISTLT